MPADKTKGDRRFGLQARAVRFACVALLVQVLVFTSMALMLSQSQKSAEKLAYSHRALTSCALLTASFDDAVHCWFWATLTHDPKASERFAKLSHRITELIAEMTADTHAPAEDRKEIQAMSRAAVYVLDRMQNVHNETLYRHNPEANMDALKTLRMEVYPYYLDLLRLAEELSDRHRQLKTTYQLQSDPNRIYPIFLAVLLLSNCVLTIGAIFYFTKRVVRRLDVIGENFERFAGKQELLTMQDDKDDISSLDVKFHGMCRSLEEATARDQAIFANLPVGLISCSTTGEVRISNPLAQAMADLSAVTHVEEIFDDAPEVVASVLTKTDSSPVRLNVRSLDGELVPCDVSVARYTLEGEQTLLLALLDVSDREKVEKLRAEFFNIVCHDIRSPISSLEVCFDMFETGILGDLNVKGEQYVERGQNLISRITKLTGDILNISKIESGELRFYKSTCDVSTLMTNAAESILSDAEARGVSVEIEPSSLELFGDPDRIVQVLMNFLSNALKFTPPGGTIRIYAEKSDSCIRINVKDQGPGISDELLAVIFERFKQANRSDQNRGSGLGLAICKLLAQGHGGSVGAKSCEDRGSTFWLDIPLDPSCRLATTGRRRSR